MDPFGASVDELSHFMKARGPEGDAVGADGNAASGGAGSGSQPASTPLALLAKECRYCMNLKREDLEVPEGTVTFLDVHPVLVASCSGIPRRALDGTTKACLLFRLRFEAQAGGVADAARGRRRGRPPQRRVHSVHVGRGGHGDTGTRSGLVWETRKLRQLTKNAWCRFKSEEVIHL